MADDDVQLTDLEVIQRYSLAVRGASASRSELIAALAADLEWLKGGRAAASRSSTAKPTTKPAAKPAVKRAAKRAPATRPAKG